MARCLATLAEFLTVNCRQVSVGCGIRRKNLNGIITQLVEYVTFNDRVSSSNLDGPTILKKLAYGVGAVTGVFDTLSYRANRYGPKIYLPE